MDEMNDCIILFDNNFCRFEIVIPVNIKSTHNCDYAIISLKIGTIAS